MASQPHYLVSMEKNIQKLTRCGDYLELLSLSGGESIFLRIIERTRYSNCVVIKTQVDGTNEIRTFTNHFLMELVGKVVFHGSEVSQNPKIWRKRTQTMRQQPGTQLNLKECVVDWTDPGCYLEFPVNGENIFVVVVDRIRKKSGIELEVKSFNTLERFYLTRVDITDLLGNIVFYGPHIPKEYQSLVLKAKIAEKNTVDKTVTPTFILNGSLYRKA